MQGDGEVLARGDMPPAASRERVALLTGVSCFTERHELLFFYTSACVALQCGLAHPNLQRWRFEFPFPGCLIPTFLAGGGEVLARGDMPPAAPRQC